MPRVCSRAKSRADLRASCCCSTACGSAGEIRGGRFVELLGGEQFALIEAVEELRRCAAPKARTQWLAISAADPLNLAALPDDAPRVAAPASRRLVFRNGVAVAAQTTSGVAWLAALDPAEQKRAAQLLAPEDRALPPYRARGWSRR